jgi:heavy metal sensor kinase
MIFKSIRWRLQLWHGLILVGVLSGFGVTAYQVARNNQLRRVDQELDQRLMALLRPPPEWAATHPPEQPPNQPPEPRPPDPAAILSKIRAAIEQPNAQDAGDTNAFYFVLWNRDGSVLARSPSAPPNVPMPQGTPPAQPQPEPTPGPGAGSNGPFSLRAPPPFQPGRTRANCRELARYLPQGQHVLVGRSLVPELTAMHRLAYELIAAGSAVLALGLAGGFWLASRAIHPIEEISGTATKISAGDLSQRINVADTESELGRLASVLNSTFARLEAAFAQQARFTADASHELRTPVSVILTQAQTALSRPRTDAEYRGALEACQRAAQRMRKLTASLLELARLDAGQDTVKAEPLDLAKVTAECIEMLRPLATEREITIHSELATAQCRGDAERLAQVVTNLVTNAIYFNRERGEVRVSTRAENGAAILTVSDTGPGIPAEELPHIFERFYRVDKSRTSAQGRTGLGLAICKAIVDSHAGSIDVKSQPGNGSTFTVTLTLNLERGR